MRSRTVSAEWLLGEPMFFPRPCHPFPFGGTKALFSGAFWLRLVSGMVFSEDFWKAKNITFQLSRVYQLLPWKSEWNILLLHLPSFNFKVIDRRIRKHTPFLLDDVRVMSTIVLALLHLQDLQFMDPCLPNCMHPHLQLSRFKIPWFKKPICEMDGISSLYCSFGT